MAITKPYYGIYRPFMPGKTFNDHDYLIEPDFFESKDQHIMAYYLIAEDLKKVFEFIEPVSVHDGVYSHRLYELLLRTCTEIESIFSELLNKHDYKVQKGFGANDNINMIHYFELEKYLKLSSYSVTFRDIQIFSPYLEWNGTTYHSLHWYSGYNNVKHNRYSSFTNASLKNVITALSGLYVLLYAQFYEHADYFVNQGKLALITSGDVFSLGNPPYYKLFFIKDKPTWADPEKYDFTWATLKSNADRFQKITF